MLWGHTIACPKLSNIVCNHLQNQYVLILRKHLLTQRSIAYKFGQYKHNCTVNIILCFSTYASRMSVHQSILYTSSNYFVAVHIIRILTDNVPFQTGSCLDISVKCAKQSSHLYRKACHNINQMLYLLILV